MSQTPLTVACVAQSAKTALPNGLCDRFAEAVRFAAKRPVRAITEPENADLTLVVLQAGPQAFSARIDTAQGPGAPRAMSRRDAPLDDAAHDALLAGLVAKAPLP
ncbi:hypothetical protein [Aestuariicoccus sp. MJ-SS9]|uniref:hypothetical protein n=1 Tax=Aestuariicoccus sp. MJ-SS9 TaxID=3079855 RepID=UPI00290B83C5|nr:hypothetical protein [Aestuariicoccus sp. MJ-SS9]MDU8912143.1 hypothetical protein [Aestuariicoccus sp. MJ-SS9]